MRAAVKPSPSPEAKTPRPDANRIALRAARSILEAAAPFELSLVTASVSVEVERLPGPAWPAETIPGLSKSEDGPWPSPVRLRCAWSGGSATLIMSAASRREEARYGRSVGIQVATATPMQRLLWISVPRAIRAESDGARVWVPSPLRVLDRSQRRGAATAQARERADARLHASELRGAALRSGLAIGSARHVEAFAVRLPEGEVLPLPGDAFARITHLALVLLPFAAMTRPGLFEGEPPFDVHALPSAAHAGVNAEGARLAKLYALPGGARDLKATLDAWLSWIRDARPPVLMFRDAVRARYGADGSATADDALRLLVTAKLAQVSSGALELTREGEAYSVDPAPTRLFDRMNARYAGLLEALVLAATPGIEGAASFDRLLAGLLERRWRSPSQARLRESWLASMGLIERDADGVRITSAGLRALRERAAEASEIRRRIEDLLEAEREVDLEIADAAAERAGVDEEEGPFVVLPSEEPSGGAAPSDERRAPKEERAPAPGDEPTNDAPPRLDEPVDITTASLRPYLRGLRFNCALIESACAALSSGKHLLLVGPPGTGKTELAIAIGAAARASGYCRDLITSTATADWTTFDTIGGYAVQRAGDVRFRPGVFLRAIERRAWLLIDELNRADIDRAFGELLTVLAGRAATTPFAQDDGRLVSIGPDPGCSHRVPPSFRLIATMNTWDKTSLFRLSFAIERRFATIYVGAPDDDALAAIVREAALSSEGEAEAPLDARSLEAMTRLFRSSGIIGVRPVGPAIAVDMIRYMRRRGAGGDGFAEALVMLLLPQLEGLGAAEAARAYELAASIVSGWASPSSAAELRARFRDLFPLVKLKDP